MGGSGCGQLALRVGRAESLNGIVFFFQAEDGIRDVAVTGVQTCALPISYSVGSHQPAGRACSVCCGVWARRLQEHGWRKELDAEKCRDRPERTLCLENREGLQGNALRFSGTAFGRRKHWKRRRRSDLSFCGWG